MLIDETKLLDLLKSGPKPHSQIRETFGILDKEAYEREIAPLYTTKKVAPYRCRGGGLRLPNAVSTEAIDLDALQKQIEQSKQQESDQEKSRERLERDLYPCLETWAINEGYDPVVIVGDKHRRSTWENPDLLALSVEDMDFFVDKEITVISIEVKLVFEATGIWQAAHYRTFSHYVYLACFENRESIRRKEDGRLFELATSLGIGVIALHPAGAGGTGIACYEIHSASRQMPTLSEVDRLLSDYRPELNVSPAEFSIAEKLGRIGQKKPA